MTIRCTRVAALLIYCALARGLSNARDLLPAGQAQQWAEQMISGMTLEEKVGQIVFVDITPAYAADDDPKLKHWLNLITRHGIGGMVLYGGTPRDVAALLNRLQKAARIPVLMAADFEGGPGQQVKGATEFPSNMAFAAIGSEELMYRAAVVGAIEGRAMGVHLTYSPVVDFATQPENPGESVRSFGGNIDLLGRLVKAYIRGYMENGMLTAAKHFPGRANTTPFPKHPKFTMIDKSADAIEAEDLAAFKKAIDAGIPFIMTEHIAVPSITGGSDLPASVERKLATGWIRDKLNFQGLLTTDDLWYDQVVERFGAVEVGIKALQAGHDLLLKPKNPVAVIQAVVGAVQRGEIPQAHIDQAVRKLLVWKARLRLHQHRFVDEAKIGTLVGTQKHWALAQEVADRSLTLLKNENVFPLANGALTNVVNISIQKFDVDSSPATLESKLKDALPGLQSFTLHPHTSAAVRDAAVAAIKSADLVTVSLFIQRERFADPAPLRPVDLDIIEQAFAAKPRRVIVMSYGNPYLVRKLSKAPAFVVGYGEQGWYGNQTIYFDSFIRFLKGQIKPQGALPVKVSADYPIGSGIKW
jgi:beta-N-acetylhexosaminidase